MSISRKLERIIFHQKLFIHYPGRELMYITCEIGKTLNIIAIFAYNWTAALCPSTNRRSLSGFRMHYGCLPDRNRKRTYVPTT